MSELQLLIEDLRLGNIPGAVMRAGMIDPSEWVHVSDVHCECRGRPIITHCGCCLGDHCTGRCGTCGHCGLEWDERDQVHTPTGRWDCGPLYEGVATGYVKFKQTPATAGTWDTPPTMNMWWERDGRLAVSWEFSICLDEDDHVKWLIEAFDDEVFSVLREVPGDFDLVGIEIDIMGKTPDEEA